MITKRVLASRWRRALSGLALLGSCSSQQCTGVTQTPGSVTCLSSVALNPTARTIEQGETTTFALVLTPRGCDARTTTYSSSDPTVALVNAVTGLVTGVLPRAGAVTIAVTVQALTGPLTATAQITVVNPTVASVIVAPINASVGVNGTQLFTATPTSAFGVPVPGQTITYSSANPAIATVVPNTGVVTGAAPGSTVITALASPSNRMGSAPIVVTAPPVTTVNVTPSGQTVPIGTFLQLFADTRGAGNVLLSGRNIVWSSSAPAVASVTTGGGLVRGESGGTATITATSEGVSGTAIVDVIAGAGCTIISADFDSPASNPFSSITFTESGGASQTATYTASGGASGAYLQLKHILPSPSSLVVDHVHPTAYSAATQGAITYIDYSEYRIELLPPFVGAAIGGGMIIRQGSSRVLVSLTNGVFTNPIWSQAGVTNLRPADLPGINFTTSGAPIQFGFYRSNSANAGGATVTTTHGIDNFEVKVCRAPPP